MIAVVGGTLIDGMGRYQAEPVNVVIDGDRVAGVGPAAAAPVPPGATVIDARGRFLTPGLV
ncbi:MAG: amidohydrolase, partial [Candidatus Rokuibacteriota bacterium]